MILKRIGYRRCVLVLGAGASAPYGFPTAGDLRELIIQRDSDSLKTITSKLNTTSGLVDKVRMFTERFHKSSEIRRFQNEFFLSQVTSVDAFVQSRKGEFGDIAKDMVAAILLHCEAAANLNNDWYQLFRNVLLEDGPVFPSDACSIITFNYDRSIERFLWLAIQYSFGLPVGTAYKHLQKLRIHHVYGSLGELRDGTHGAVVEWGATTDQQIRDAGNALHLMQPRRLDNRSDVHKWLSNAEVVCFLGFGFWRENLEFLLPSINTRSQLYASAQGLSQLTKDNVVGQQALAKMKWADGCSAHDCLQRWNLFLT